MTGSFKNSKVAVILGPTCTGKTLLAIDLCKRFNGAVISADSRQVACYMDIGTGKIPAGESDRGINRRDGRWTVDGIDIFGYDLVNPDEYFSAYDFVNYCRKTILRILNEPVKSPFKEKIIFIVGGTGFYIDAVTGRTALAGVSPDTELRQSLESLSTEELAEKLLGLDESVYKTVDIKNPARLVRAIEKASQFYGVPQRFEERAVRSGTRNENAVESVRTEIIFLTPRGKTYHQVTALQLSTAKNLILICGRYECIDQLVVEYFTNPISQVANIHAQEISIGNYVLSGGEVAAMAIIESIARLIPGVIENKEALVNESFNPGCPNQTEHPQYSRPKEWKGLKVPQTLLSGHHGKIKKWKDSH